MQREGERHIPLEGAHNVRDIGGYPAGAGQTTRWRTFLRAASLHKLSPAGQQALLDYGLRTVIDLRYEQEVLAAPNVFAQSGAVHYVNLSLFAGTAPARARNAPPNLESMYRYILDERQAVVRTVLEVMTTDAFPVLVHCTAGKDRTGVITALMLGLAGVDHATIAEDYALTAHYGAALLDELRADAVAAGRDTATYERFLEAKPVAMLKTLAHLESTYGGIRAYLQQIGLTTTQIDQLAHILVTASRTA
ncbi:MAG: tyrosine-protein phosphatase [Caldilineaceae bacterium]